MTRTPVPRSVDELQALALQGERRDVEFKEAVHEKPAIRKVVRAVAAMANLREGGLVVLGVEDKTGVLRGLSTKDMAQWGDRDNVLSTVNATLEPAVELEVHRIGACVVLEVRPFSRVPIVARVSKGEAHQPDALVEGALLYRSSVMTSSAPISRMEDWNELRETLLIRALAGAKRLEDERKRAEHAADEERITTVQQLRELPWRGLAGLVSGCAGVSEVGIPHQPRAGLAARLFQLGDGLRLAVDRPRLASPLR